MRCLFFILLFTTTGFSASGQTIIGKAINNRTDVPIKGLIVHLKDSCSGKESIDTTDNDGILRFDMSSQCGKYFLYSESMNPKPCSRGYLSFKKTISALPQDTLLINPIELIVDYELPAFRFRESSFIFSSMWDTLTFCDLLSPDTMCGAFHDLSFFRTLSCIGYSRIQLTSYYVKSEANTVGDSLAGKRCELMIDYLYNHGFSRDITFDIKCIPYEKRPRKSSYGYFLPEFNCVIPTILAY